MSTNLKSINSVHRFNPMVDLSDRAIEEENAVWLLAAIGGFAFATWYCKAILKGKVTVGFPAVWQCTF